jgi:DNA topoisomerase-1
VITTLVIAEKPDAAVHVAEALHPKGEPRKLTYMGVPIYEVERPSGRVLVCSALGHLYKVDQVGITGRRRYPVWDYAWKPIHLAERGHEKQHRWLTAIAELSRKADAFMSACDFDVEGSLIGYTILKYACGGADAVAKRMKFSTLTPGELRDAYENPLPHLDLPLVTAGQCRHEIDWLYGINLSRALTASARKVSGRYATVSTGRVQGPTLRFLVEREREIETFVPVPHWQIQATVEVNGEPLQAEYEAEILSVKADAERVAALSTGKEGHVEDVATKTAQLVPPTPFDLSSLQAEAYRHFRMTPRYSLQIAERLYLDTLISYPRTSSQKLPPSISYRRILEGLGRNPDYQTRTVRLLDLRDLRPNDGDKTDPAHPAVYPTGTLPKRSLDTRESKVYDLIVKRFMATFGTPAIRETMKATIGVEGLTFYLRGSRIVTPGWIDFYAPYARFESVSLPAITKGSLVNFLSVVAVEKLSQPPPRYNPSSLLREMEANGIGTKATRAEIIETLSRRAYITGERIEVTPLGDQVIDVLERYCPRVLDVAFTRELENMMADIELGKEEKQQVVNHLKPVMEELITHEKEVGEQLVGTIRQARTSDMTLSVSCPKCRGTLQIVKSRKSGKRFIGCLGKWEGKCSFTLPLPQLGRLTLLDQRCAKCGFQLVKVTSTRRRPLIACPLCYVNK